jgi:hypothetical protein
VIVTPHVQLKASLKADPFRALHEDISALCRDLSAGLRRLRQFSETAHLLSAGVFHYRGGTIGEV